MPLKKSELYSSLWQSCDELRGGMDASQYKDYVLVLLFMKYVSDKAASTPGYLLDVPKGGSFADMVALKGDKEIGDKMNKIVAKLAEANDLTIIKEADFNDDAKLGKGKEMVDRLTNLVAIFENLDFGGNRADGDDLLGDAYEYLMRHFATESGKSKGQFYTPAEVSRIMAQVIGVGQTKDSKQTIYDPTCGSGSLLLKAHDEPLRLWTPLPTARCQRARPGRSEDSWQVDRDTGPVRSGRIWLNLELAKKPVRCLEYLIVHELVHMIERTHNERFVALMDKHLPDWKARRTLLNAQPLAHDTWGY